MSFRSWFTHRQLARTFERLQREWRRSPRRRWESHFCLSAEVLVAVVKTKRRVLGSAPGRLSPALAQERLLTRGPAP